LLKDVGRSANLQSFEVITIELFYRIKELPAVRLYCTSVAKFDIRDLSRPWIVSIWQYHTELDEHKGMRKLGD